MIGLKLVIKIKYIPNLLTILRILLTPFFVYFLLTNGLHSKLIATIIFTLASISDALDGKIARRYGVETKFGKFFDPLADKILILSALISFVIIGHVKIWMFLLIFFRDVLITSLRYIMQSKGIVMHTSNYGKLKTFFQVIAINVILFYLIIISYDVNTVKLFFINYPIIDFFMIITTLVTVLSGLHYFYKNNHILFFLIKK